MLQDLFDRYLRRDDDDSSRVRIRLAPEVVDLIDDAMDAGQYRSPIDFIIDAITYYCRVVLKL